MLHEMKWENMSPSSSVAFSGNMPMLYPMNAGSTLNEVGNGSGENRLEKLWKAIFGVEKPFPSGICDEGIEAIIQNELDGLLPNTSEVEVAADGVEDNGNEKVSNRSESEWSEEEGGTRSSGIKRGRAGAMGGSQSERTAKRVRNEKAKSMPSVDRKKNMGFSGYGQKGEHMDENGNGSMSDRSGSEWSDEEGDTNLSGIKRERAGKMGDSPIERSDKRVRREIVKCLPVDRRKDDGVRGHNQMIGYQLGIMDGGISHFERLNEALIRLSRNNKTLIESNMATQRLGEERRKLTAATALIALQSALRTQALSKCGEVTKTDGNLQVLPLKDEITSELYDPYAALSVYHSRTLTRQTMPLLPCVKENAEFFLQNDEVHTTMKSTNDRINVSANLRNANPPLTESIELHLGDSILHSIQLPHGQLPPQNIVRNK